MTNVTYDDYLEALAGYAVLYTPRTGGGPQMDPMIFATKGDAENRRSVLMEQGVACEEEGLSDVIVWKKA